MASQLLLEIASNVLKLMLLSGGSYFQNLVPLKMLIAKNDMQDEML